MSTENPAAVKRSSAKAPPHSDEAEQAVLGSMLLERDAIARVVEMIRGDDFYTEAHRRIFAAIADLFGRGEPVDLITVTDRLKARGQLEDVGGAAYVTSLLDAVPTAANVDYYARLVLRDSVKRGLADLVAEVGHASRDGHNPEELIVLAGQVVEHLRQRLEFDSSAPEALHFKVMTAATLCALPEPETTDELLGPLLKRGERVALGAHTGHGKTTFAIHMGKAVVTRGPFLDWQGTGGTVLFIDAEQGLRTIKRRLREAGLDTSEHVHYLRAPDGLSLDKNAAEVAALGAVFAAGRYDVVVLDPAYKLHTGDSNAEREAVDLMRLFDRWREEYGFALVLPMHCRKPPAIGGGRLTMHEFFGSSAYLRGAEVVLGLSFIRPGYSRLHFFKDRDGDLAVGQVWGLLFDRQQGFRRDPKDGKPTAAEQIRELLTTDPKMTNRELAEALGLKEDTVRKTRGRLPRAAHTHGLDLEDGRSGDDE